MGDVVQMRKNKTKRRKFIIPASLIGLVLVSVGLWYATRPKIKTATPAPTKQQVDDADKLQKPTDSKNASGDTTTPSVSSTSAATTTDNIYIVISRPVNNDKLALSKGIQFRSTITGASSGSCTLNLSGPSGQSLTKTATLTLQNNYTSCSIDVPSSQLSPGQWILSLTVTSGSTTTKPATEKVTLT